MAGFSNGATFGHEFPERDFPFPPWPCGGLVSNPELHGRGQARHVPRGRVVDALPPQMISFWRTEYSQAKAAKRLINQFF